VIKAFPVTLGGYEIAAKNSGTGVLYPPISNTKVMLFWNNNDEKLTFRGNV